MTITKIYGKEDKAIKAIQDSGLPILYAGLLMGG